MGQLWRYTRHRYRSIIIDIVFHICPLSVNRLNASIATSHDAAENVYYARSVYRACAFPFATAWCINRTPTVYIKRPTHKRAKDAHRAMCNYSYIQNGKSIKFLADSLRVFYDAAQKRSSPPSPDGELKSRFERNN